MPDVAKGDQTWFMLRMHVRFCCV